MNDEYKILNERENTKLNLRKIRIKEFLYESKIKSKNSTAIPSFHINEEEKEENEEKELILNCKNLKISYEFQKKSIKIHVNSKKEEVDIVKILILDMLNSSNIYDKINSINGLSINLIDMSNLYDNQQEAKEDKGNIYEVDNIDMIMKSLFEFFIENDMELIKKLIVYIKENINILEVNDDDSHNNNIDNNERNNSHILNNKIISSIDNIYHIFNIITYYISDFYDSDSKDYLLILLSQNGVVSLYEKSITVFNNKEFLSFSETILCILINLLYEKSLYIHINLLCSESNSILYQILSLSEKEITYSMVICILKFINLSLSNVTHNSKRLLDKYYSSNTNSNVPIKILPFSESIYSYHRLSNDILISYIKLISRFSIEFPKKEDVLQYSSLIINKIITLYIVNNHVFHYLIESNIVYFLQSKAGHMKEETVYQLIVISMNCINGILYYKFSNEDRIINENLAYLISYSLIISNKTSINTRKSEIFSSLSSIFYSISSMNNSTFLIEWIGNYGLLEKIVLIINSDYVSNSTIYNSILSLKLICENKNLSHLLIKTRVVNMLIEIINNKSDDIQFGYLVDVFYMLFSVLTIFQEVNFDIGKLKAEVYLHLKGREFICDLNDHISQRIVELCEKD